MTNFPPWNDEQSKSASPSPDWPSHDYWMYDENGEFIYKYAHTMGDHPDREFLENTDYEEKWAQRFFWSANQAAALSFGRSPDEVTWDAYMESMYESSEFATHLGDLRDRILAAQRDQTLPEAIPPVMYAQWAQLNRLPFPPALAEDVATFFANVMQMTNDRVSSVLADAEKPARPADVESIKATRSNPRKERNLLGAIYALAWKHHRFGELSTTTVAGRIETIIDQLVPLMSGTKIEASSQTIADWLREAIRDFGDPPKKET
jgi:hypothetical protein